MAVSSRQMDQRNRKHDHLLSCTYRVEFWGSWCQHWSEETKKESTDVEGQRDKQGWRRWWHWNRGMPSYAKFRLWQGTWWPWAKWRKLHWSISHHFNAGTCRSLAVIIISSQDVLHHSNLEQEHVQFSVTQSSSDMCWLWQRGWGSGLKLKDCEFES